jgi:hypothetical protein
MTTSTSASAQAANQRADMAALDTLYAGDSLTVFESAGINRGWKDYRLEGVGTGDKMHWVVRHSHTASRARRPNDPPMPQ